MPTILMVGARRGALRAAEQLGMEVLLLDDDRPSSRRRAPIAGFAQVELERRTGLASSRYRDRLRRAALALVGDRRVDAVVGLTERAVVPAAIVREALGVDGVGSDVALACHDKVAMKRATGAAGLPQAAWRKIGPRTRAEALVETLGLPLVLKQRASSGARGARVCADIETVRGALRPGWIAERFVQGTEMSIEAFVAGGRVIFSNLTEYLVPFWANVLPATLPSEQATAVRDLHRRVVTALGITRGITHLEVFLGPEGPVFGELALRPPGGHLMQLLERAYDFDPWEALLRVERGERPALPDRAQRSAGAFVLHPGPGVVRSVRGVSAARAEPGVVDLVCRVRRGDTVAPRVGSGEAVGHIFVVGADRDVVAAALCTSRKRIRIEMHETTPTDASTGSSMLSSAPVPSRSARRRTPRRGRGSAKVR